MRFPFRKLSPSSGVTLGRPQKCDGMQKGQPKGFAKDARPRALGLVLQHLQHFPIFFDFKHAVLFSDVVTRQLDVWLKVLTTTTDPTWSNNINTDA